MRNDSFRTSIRFSVLSFRDKYRFYACLLRARFDENKPEVDMIKATLMLKAGEEEFWANQHPQPYLFPDSPGGTSYERYECFKVSGKFCILCTVCDSVSVISCHSNVNNVLR